MLELLDHGSHVLVCDDFYGGTYRLFERVRRRTANLDFSYVDPTDLTKFRGRRSARTRGMIWIETPSNPLLKLADLAAIADVGPATRHSVAWPTTRSPRPTCSGRWTLGFDIVVHSVTKYLNGHSDMIGGIAVVGERQELVEQTAASCRTPSAESAGRSIAFSRCAA